MFHENAILLEILSFLTMLLLRLYAITGVRKDGSGQLQTSLTDLKPPAAPNHSKRITDMHG